MRLLYQCISILIVLHLLSGCSSTSSVLNFEGNKVYYASTVTRVEAARLGNYLDKAGYFSKEEPENLRLQKLDRDYEISWAIWPEFRFSDEKLTALQQLEDSLSLRAFDDNKVTVFLSKERLNPIWSVKDSPGILKKIEDHELYVKPPVTMELADTLIDFLAKNTTFLEKDDDGNIMQISESGDKLIFRLAIDRNALFHPLIESCRNLQLQLTRQLFPDELVDVEICDKLFSPIEVIMDQPYAQKWALGGYEIKYSSSISLREAASLRDYLFENKLLEHSAMDIGLSKREGVFLLAYQAKLDVASPAETKMARTLMESLSRDVFQGQEVEIQLFDSEKQNFRIVKKEVEPEAN